MRAQPAILVGVLLLSFILVGMGPAALVGPLQASHVSTSVSTFDNKLTSSNWAGYAVTGATFTDVKGTWTQPAVVGSCPSSARYASFWVGIDGYNSKTVEQIGTDSDCSHGSPSYYAWYEMYPANSVNIATLPIHPGDVLTGEVKVSGTSFKLSLKDATSGKSFSITKKSSSAKKSSAEWIAEAPEVCSPTCSIAKLNDFGTLHFTNSEAATTGGDRPIDSFTGGSGPHEITMDNAAFTKVRASPSGLGSSGETFTVSWKSA